MRRLPLLLALAAVVAALAAGGASAAPAARAAKPVAETSPGKVLSTFVKAAGTNDTATMWGLLSSATKKRFGGSLEAFRKGEAPELVGALGQLARGDAFTMRMSEKLSSVFAFAVVTSRRVVKGQKEEAAYAAAMRAEGAGWKLELGGPVSLRVIGPDQGEVVAAPEPQMAVEAKAKEQIIGAILYADGVPIDGNAGGTGPNNVTIYGVATNVAKPGVHYGAAVAGTATDISAVAWTFGFVPAKTTSGKLPKGIKPAGATTSG